MSSLGIISTLTWRDLFDIIFLSLVTYQLFVWFKGTKALRALIGLVVLGAVYTLAKFWGLFMITWAFQILWQVLVILLLILFQSEIRQVLEKVSPLRYLRTRPYTGKAALLEETVATVFEMAADGVGAIIVLTREDNPAEFIHGGQNVMALPGAALIKSIFNPAAPAHDGAIIISEDKLTQMGAFLPLTEREDVPDKFGTRHRAALGLSEKTDCICLVVSEERREVSSVVGGEIIIWEDEQNLGERLKGWLGLTEAPKPTLNGFLKVVFTENWGAKIGALVLVSLAWFILAGQQEMTLSLKTQVEYVNIPRGLVLSPDSLSHVSVELAGRRKQTMALTDGEVRVRVDLGHLATGPHTLKLSAGNVDMPLGLMLKGVIPPNVYLNLKQENAGSSPAR